MIKSGDFSHKAIQEATCKPIRVALWIANPYNQDKQTMVGYRCWATVPPISAEIYLEAKDIRGRYRVADHLWIDFTDDVGGQVLDCLGCNLVLLKLD